MKNTMANVCPICNNPLRQYGKDFYVCEVCETYFDKNENIVLTEQEWLQTATTEQLAEFINYIAGQCSINKLCKLCNGWCHKDDVEKWLKQPHHD